MVPVLSSLTSRSGLITFRGSDGCQNAGTSVAAADRSSCTYCRRLDQTSGDEQVLVSLIDTQLQARPGLLALTRTLTKLLHPRLLRVQVLDSSHNQLVAEIRKAFVLLLVPSSSPLTTNHHDQRLLPNSLQRLLLCQQQKQLGQPVLSCSAMSPPEQQLGLTLDGRLLAGSFVLLGGPKTDGTLAGTPDIRHCG